jgi:hypothetical protein
LLGDSHAAQWFPALEKISTIGKLNLISMTKSSCPAILQTVKNAWLGRAYNECDEWKDNVLKLLDDIRPQYVIISSSQIYINEIGIVKWPCQNAFEIINGIRQYNID